MISAVYGALVTVKNFLYDSGLLDSVHCRIPVLSVGNLSAGGSGKTPMVDFLLSECRKRQIKAAVISRNYKAQSRGVEKVSFDHPQGAFYYGDEAFLLASKNPDMAVWTGPEKFVTAQKCDFTDQYDLLIVDDGFQHRKLAKDFEIVLLDASVALSEYRLLPSGKLREGFASLQRADSIIFTKVNWDNEGIQEKLLERMLKELQRLDLAKVFDCKYQIKLQTPPLPEERFLLVSGIAQPHSLVKSFEEYQLKVAPDCLIVDHLVYPDHHAYSDEDLDKIMRTKKELGCSRVLTTEKDLVKLRQLSANSDVQALQLSLEFNRSPEKIYEFFDKIRRH